MATTRTPPMIRKLLSPRAYPHPAQDVRLEETHISWVLSAGRYAYKLKKPVDLGFVDLSSRKKRAADCAEEVRLNRRLCPDVYLGVVDVVERDGHVRMGGSGRAVEPAVRMRRLPDDGMLPRLLATGAADERLMRRLANHLARFHATAATGPGVDEYGSLATIRANWDENFAQTAPLLGHSLAEELDQSIRAHVQRFVREQSDLFKGRVARGMIRDGHGDLHAASICVEGRRVRLFDCVEFAARFRCADVAAEAAFLAMDLAHRGRADLSFAFVDAYMQASGDHELLRLIDFYSCYRAYVRGKVLGMRLGQLSLAQDEALGIESEARAYFDLAWAYAVGFGRPLLLVTMGLPASGKTTLAEALAGRLGLVHLSSDIVRKELAGVGPRQRQRERFGEGAYSSSMTRRTYATMRRRAARWLRRGVSVVLDATHGKPEERAAVRRLASRLGSRLMVFVCEADEAELRARLAGRGESTVSDAQLELWPALKAAYSPPAELANAVVVDTSTSSSEAASRAVAAVRGVTG